MNDPRLRSLAKLSDDDLVRDLVGLVGYGRRVSVRVLDFLSEVDSRQIHIREGYSSLFDFCRRKLGFSEGEAIRRVSSSRLLKRFPWIRPELESGSVHMTSLHLIHRFVTPANVRDLLGRVRGKTKREVEDVVVELDPKKKRPTIAPIDQMRRLPPSRLEPATPPQPAPLLALLVTPASTPPPPAPPALPSPTPTSAEPSSQLKSEPATPSAAEMLAALTPSAPSPGPSTSTGATSPKVAAGPSSAPRLALESAAIPAPPAAEYAVGFVASQELHDKLERLRNLLAHGNPSGDLGPIIERAVDLLLAKVEKDRLARTERPARPARPAVDASHISNETRRIVIARDGWRCSWVGRNGERCTSCRMLEFDHVVPVARGGTGEPTNVRILCRPHNLGAARLVFGAEHVEACIARRRQERRAAKKSTSGSQPARSAHAPTTRRDPPMNPVGHSGGRGADPS